MMVAKRQDQALMTKEEFFVKLDRGIPPPAAHGK